MNEKNAPKLKMLSPGNPQTSENKGKKAGHICILWQARLFLELRGK